MSNRRRKLVSNREERMWKRLVEDFRDEVACFEDGLDTLASCVLAKVKSQPIFSGPDPIRELKEADHGTRDWGVWTLLLNEALERLEASRLLLLTGHQSRALSCARDAFECILWAHICLRDDRQANRWLQNHKPKPRNDFDYPAQLSSTIRQKVQEVFSPSGTHAYLDACMRSLNPRAVLVPKRAKNAEVSKVYRQCTRFGFYAILLVVDTAIEYVLGVDPSAAQGTPGAQSVVERIESTIGVLLEEIRGEASEVSQYGEAM